MKNLESIKKIKINEEELRELVSTAVRQAEGFEWSGWGIDILCNDEGQIWASEFNNGNRIYQTANVITRVGRWSWAEMDDPNPDREEAIEWHVDNITDELLSDIEDQYIELV